MVDLGQELDLWAVKNTESQGNHLQILGSGGGGDVSGLGADIVYDGLLEPWDEEVGSFVDNLCFPTIRLTRHTTMAKVA